MSFTATINSQGNFTASVNGSTVFNVSAPESVPMNVGMAVIGPSGLLTADSPLIYDSVLKNISIDLSDYATLAYTNATFYPLTNPAGYITSAALNGYATESWVLGNGYITSAALAPYLLSSTAASTYATITELTSGLATKQPVGDYATNTALNAVEDNLQEQIDGKQPSGDYATNSALTTGLATKQPVGDYATNTDLSAGLATKQPIGDYATNSALNLLDSHLQGQIDGKQPAGDYATNSALTAGLATKQDVGDYATNTALTNGLATKANVVHTHTIAQVDGLTEELAGKQPTGDYATNTALSTGLAGKADVIHTHDASAIVSGVIDIARIPVIPSQVQVFAAEPDITQLTPEEQAQITGSGVVVVLSNGERWMYKGAGSKTDYASYVQISDLTPDWNSIENKPSTFAPSAHTHPISDVVGLQTALDGKSPLFDQSLNTTNEVSFANLQTDSITIPDGGGNDLIIDESGILFTDGTLQNTAGVSQASLTTQLGAYLTTASASATYQPISGMSNYLTVVDAAATYYPVTNPSGYITSASLAGYATEAWTTLNFAPIGWNPFNQTLNTTDVVGFQRIEQSGSVIIDDTGAGGGRIEIKPTGLNLRSGVGLSFSDFTTQTTAGISPADAAATYYPLTNPSGYIDSSALAGYATESWVTSQGYLTAPYNPFDQSLNTTDSPTFAGLTTNGSIVFNDSATPASTYQFKWNPSVAIAGVYAGAIPIVELTSNGIVLGTIGASLTFSDGTVQTTAATTPDLTPYAQKAVTNTFTASQVIEVTDNTNAALRITQLGTGEAFRVEDAANPDTTAFIVDAAGNVCIKGSGTNASYPLVVAGNAWVQGILNVQGSGSVGVQSNYSGTGVGAWFQHNNTGATTDAFRITNLGSGNSLVVEDSTNPDSTPFIINSAGATIIGGTTPQAKLTVSELGIYSTSNNSSYPPLRTVSTGSINNNVVIQNDSTSGNSLLIRNGTTDNKVTVNKNGYVGIGVTPSSYPLEVNGTASVTTLRFNDGTTQTTAATAADQSLNTTSSVNFATVTTATAGQTPTLLSGAVDENANILNWQYGLKQFYIKPSTIRYRDNSTGFYWDINQYGLSIYESYGSVDMYAGDGIYFYDNSTGQQFSFSQYGLYFPDGTIQTTAASGGGGGTPTFPYTIGDGTASAYFYETSYLGAGVRFENTGSALGMYGEYARKGFELYETEYGGYKLAGYSAPTGDQLVYSDPSRTLWRINTAGLDIWNGITSTYARYTADGIYFADGTFQSTAGGGGGGYNQNLNTYDPVQFNDYNSAGGVQIQQDFDGQNVVKVNDAFSSGYETRIRAGAIRVDSYGSGIYITNGGITFADGSSQSKGYPFSGAAAAAIEGGLLNANSPSATNAFATLGDVESSVNAYAASVLPVLPTTDEKDAMANANAPSASNPFLTLPALPVSSESTSGIVELADTSESLNYTNSTKPLATDKVLGFIKRFMLKHAAYRFQGGMNAQATGTGAQYSQLATYVNFVAPNATIAGFARGYAVIHSGEPTTFASNGAFWSFSNPLAVGQTFFLNNAATGRIGTRIMGIMGEANSLTAGVALGDPTNKRIGWSHINGENIKLMVHDGTNLYFVDSGYAPPTSAGSTKHYIEFGWDGTGTAYLYIKNWLGEEYTCTSSNAPTGAPQSVVHSSYCIQLSTTGAQTSSGVNYSATNPSFYSP